MSMQADPSHVLGDALSESPQKHTAHSSILLISFVFLGKNGQPALAQENRRGLATNGQVQFTLVMKFFQLAWWEWGVGCLRQAQKS